MQLLAIRRVQTDHKDSYKLSRTRLARELHISAGTFKKYFIDIRHPKKPQGFYVGPTLVYSEKDINNFLINELIPFYAHMVLLEPKPTRVVQDPQSNYYTLRNRHNLQEFTHQDIQQTQNQP